MCNVTPFTIEKISPRVGLESGVARSVGQHLTHWLVKRWPTDLASPDDVSRPCS